MSSRHSRPTVPPDNKNTCQLYFGKDPIVGKEVNMWTCSCGTIRKQDIKVGYTNLISDIRQKHPSYLEVFNLAQQEDSQSETSSFVTGYGTPSSVSEQTTLDYMFDTASTNVFKWLECPISVKTLKKYLFKVVKALEKR